MSNQLILIPGLGADAELFYPQAEAFGQRLTVVDDGDDPTLWQQNPCMSLAADVFTKRIAGLLPADGQYVLGGMSFGGSLAMEIAARLVAGSNYPNPIALALIASNRTSDTISRSFRINRAVGSMLPKPLVRSGLGLAAKLFAKREGLDEPDRDRLRKMAGRADLTKLMWGAKAIAKWEFDDDAAAATGIPIQQMHGRSDWVIPITKRHVTSTIEDGKHLVTWTHREHVNAWLDSIGA
jgi:pimeloyl-ACP methyl ester carboxylesterase